MKIAVFHNLTGGGSVKVLADHVKYLESKGHIVDVFTICTKSTGWLTKLFTNNQNLILVKPPKNLLLQIIWIIFVLPRYHKELAARLLEEQYQFLYVHHDRFTKSPYLLRFTKLPSIYFLHEPPREFYEPISLFCEKPMHYVANLVRLPIKFIDRINTRGADIVISNSKYSQKIINNIYKIKSVLVYPPLNNKPRSLYKKKKQILFVGGLNKIKDPLFAIKVCKTLLPEYKLIVIGDGSNNYTKLVRQSAIDGNILVISHHVNNKQLTKYFSESLMILAPFTNEPFGLVSIEAQSFGCIPIVDESGGLKETVHDGHTGFVVKKNIKDYSRAINMALNNTLNMQKEMPDWLKKFGISKSFSIVDKYENLLSKRRIS